MSHKLSRLIFYAVNKLTFEDTYIPIFKHYNINIIYWGVHKTTTTGNYHINCILSHNKPHIHRYMVAVNHTRTIYISQNNSSFY